MVKNLNFFEIPQPREDSGMQESVMLRSEENYSSLTTIEDAIPLNQHSPGEGEDPDFDVPVWIHQNIIKFAKEFGIDIKGCKEEATMLFMKIDSTRQKNEKGREVHESDFGSKGIQRTEES